MHFVLDTILTVILFVETNNNRLAINFDETALLHSLLHIN